MSPMSSNGDISTPELPRPSWGPQGDLDPGFPKRLQKTQAITRRLILGGLILGPPMVTSLHLRFQEQAGDFVKEIWFLGSR